MASMRHPNVVQVGIRCPSAEWHVMAACWPCPAAVALCATPARLPHPHCCSSRMVSKPASDQPTICAPLAAAVPGRLRLPTRNRHR